MRQVIISLIIPMLLTALTACHQEENEIFAIALVTVSAGDGVTVTQVQAQALLTNVNTRQVTTSADFEGATLQVELLRGAYEVSVEGVVTCRDTAGQVRLRQFRAQTDYVELEKTGINTVTLPIIFLD